MANGIRLGVAGEMESVQVADDDRAMARVIDAPWIEVLTFRDHRTLIVVDEEGRLTNKPRNRRATMLAHMLGFEGGHLVGDALVLGCDNRGLIADVPDDIVTVAAALNVIQDVAPL